MRSLKVDLEELAFALHFRPEGMTHYLGLESGALCVRFWNDADILSLALSQDGRLLACGDAAGRVWIFDWVQ